MLVHTRCRTPARGRSVASLVALIGVAAGAALCGSFASGGEPQSVAAGAGSASLQVENAWVPQPPAGAKVAAAYFTVRNTGSERAVLVEVSSPMASVAMLHETSVVAGESRMRMLGQLVIPAGGSVTLEPGAIHVMLEGLRRPLRVGEQIPLLLSFADGQKIRVSARVRPLGSR